MSKKTVHHVPESMPNAVLHRSIEPVVDAHLESAEASTSERLVEVAGRIFAAKGRDATVREICREAGCSVAAINYYFGDKNHLYLLCVQTACERKQKLFPLPDPTEVTSGNAATLFREFLRKITSRIAASSDDPKSSLNWQNQLMLREVLSPSEGVMEMLQKPFRKDFEKLDRLFDKLLGAELDEPHVREELLTQILSRCMFLKTGRNLRKMFGIDSNTNENPTDYADIICDSILLQINALRRVRGMTELDWSVCHSDT